MMRRRDFLGALGLVPLFIASPRLAFAASVAPYRNLLVLIELKGGNDGLNTLVPYADPAYYRLRPRIGIARDAVLQLDAQVGLHPALQPLMALWQAGELAIVQGVGYPDPNLSHFRSIEIWDTASRSDEYLADGWLARVFQANPVPRSFAADGVVVGAAELGPLNGRGARAIALTHTEQFLRRARLADDVATRPANAALAHILKVEHDIAQAASGLAGNQALRTAFPPGPFGNALKTAAEVVAGSAGVAVVRVTHAGFDTHGGQPPVHERLLRELAEGLTAFRAAMREIGRWDSTLVMTYSEFGRRAQENGSLGTDHGTANVHFVLGGKVRGGLYGEAPSLARLEGGNLMYTVDFRCLYATIIEKGWGLSAAGVLNGKFPALDLLRAA
jgi:uncharacterized protein (DUF1501 family)